MGCPTLRCHGNGTRWGMSVGELINQGQKTASTSRTKPGKTNEETKPKKKKKRKIQNTNQNKKPLRNKTPESHKEKTWNGCGAENRGLKGGGQWLPPGGAPHPWQNTGSGPQHPRASVAMEVTSLEKEPSGKPTQPRWGASLHKGPLSPLLVTPRLSLKAEHTGWPLSTQ